MSIKDQQQEDNKDPSSDFINEGLVIINILNMVKSDNQLLKTANELERAYNLLNELAEHQASPDQSFKEKAVQLLVIYKELTAQVEGHINTEGDRDLVNKTIDTGFIVAKLLLNDKCKHLPSSIADKLLTHLNGFFQSNFNEAQVNDVIEKVIFRDWLLRKKLMVRIAQREPHQTNLIDPLKHCVFPNDVADKFYEENKEMIYTTLLDCPGKKALINKFILTNYEEQVLYYSQELKSLKEQMEGVVGDN